MPQAPWDCAVVGVGTMGSMVLWHLARRGLRVVGFERWKPGHSRGAAGGETRIFRTAYKEGAEYVPLLQHSYQLWRELESISGNRLLEITGALTIGRPEHPEVQEVLAAAKSFDLDVEVLEKKDARNRFPQHHLLDGEIAVLDKVGGVLNPVAAIHAAVEQAHKGGAVLHTGELAQSVHDDGKTCVVVMAGGECYRARNVVVALGPWTGKLIPALISKFQVARSTLHWFRPRKAADYLPGRFPVGIRRSGRDGDLSFFPAMGSGNVKVNLHTAREIIVDPDHFSHDVPVEYSEYVSHAVTQLLPGLKAGAVRAASFMESYSRDNHALVGRITPNIVVLTAFSGHGFKLSPTIGEIAADLVTEGTSRYFIDTFDIHRDMN